MDDLDRDIMSADFGSTPWWCDAGELTWCSRPRLYWVTWELLSQAGASVNAGEEGQPSSVQLASDQDHVEVCKSGWLKVDETRPFPTFTTARPSSKPWRKPAGILQCGPEDISRWQGTPTNFHRISTPEKIASSIAKMNFVSPTWKSESTCWGSLLAIPGGVFQRLSVRTLSSQILG